MKNVTKTTLPPGVIYEKSKGTYTSYITKTEGGRKIYLYSIGHPSIKEAKESLDEMKRKKKESEPSFDRHSLESFFASFCLYRSTFVRDSSIRSARTTYNRYLYTYKDKGVGEVFGYATLSKIYASILANKTIKEEWKNRNIGNIRELIRFAYKKRFIPSSNYAEAISILENIPEHRGERKEKEVWSAKEEKAFLNSIKNKEHHLMFSLFLELGCRLGEFLGLTWDCFDSKRRSICIKRQLLNNSQKTFVLSPILKTRESYRECKLGETLSARLEEYRQNKPEGDFLFVSPIDGTLPLSKANFRGLFEKYIALSGVKRITPHAIRHMKASELLGVCKNMIEVKAAARYMGHSPSMMINTYSHSDEKTLDTLLKRANKKKEAK